MLPAMVPEPDDISLMLRYRAGDVSAFETLYRRHKGPLYRYFLRQCRDGQAAADLFQDVWSNIIRARESYRPTARFTTFMYQIAHNCLVDHFRRQGSRLEDPAADPPDHADETPGPEALVMATEVTLFFRRALDRLPALQREAFLLREEADLSLADIALVTGTSEETVKSRLRYALKKLRTIVAAEDVA